MTWTWKCGPSWNATSPSATNRFTPLAPSVCRASSASCRATLNARIATVSLTSRINTACSRGTTSMWPCVMGWMSMNATTVSSSWVKLAGASPRTMAQKMQSLTGPAKLKGALLVLWLRFCRRGLGGRRRVGAVAAQCGFDRRRLIGDRSRAVAGSVDGHPLAAPPPSRSALAAVRSRQALHMRADADTLAGGDDCAHSGDEAILPDVLEEWSEQLGGATDHGLRVPDDDEQLFRARDGDVDAVGVVEEADGRPIVRAD